MFWTIAIETMRKEENETVFNVPFGFTGGNELI